MRLLVLVALTLSYNQVTAQECSFYYPQVAGAELTYQHYDGKDKPTGKTAHIVKDYHESGNSASATITVKNYDKKDELISETTLEVKCESGIFYFDMKAYMNQQSMSSFENMDVTIQADELEMPYNLKVGDKLKDGNLNISIKTGGMTIMSMNVSITDREVIAKENVTVPAGTFDCYKINQLVQTTGPVRFVNQSSEWLCPGTGLIKNESHSDDGKITSRTVLTSLKR
ncbi:MAG: hypothetical protein JW894_11190 [Bacteroidales bacterium]|nr:hypothetical protein [Bacteroidales bacterium]